MRFLVAANTLENVAFWQFVVQAGRDHPDADIVLCGDLLNTFPEPGEDGQGSICHAIFGTAVLDELSRLQRTQFADVQRSSLVAPLRQLFCPRGRHLSAGVALAQARYAALLPPLARALRGRRLFIAPGNMDYPHLLHAQCRALAPLVVLDGTCCRRRGLILAGVGGIVQTLQPFWPSAPVGPYEVSERRYVAQLRALPPVDVLITHLSPLECSALRTYIKEASPRMLVCRAPFTLHTQPHCRGRSRTFYIGRTLVVHVRPFCAPRNRAYLVDLPQAQAGLPRLSPTHFYAARRAEPPTAHRAVRKR